MMRIDHRRRDEDNFTTSHPTITGTVTSPMLPPTSFHLEENKRRLSIHVTLLRVETICVCERNRKQNCDVLTKMLEARLVMGTPPSADTENAVAYTCHSDNNTHSMRNHSKKTNSRKLLFSVR
jgi:hypothetical protein